MAKIIFPRDFAVRVLTRVLSDHQTLDEALAALSAEFPHLSHGPARAWLQEVCSGTLRWKGRLDQVIDSGALKKKPSGWLRKVLLVACYQLIVQDRVQPGAVVSETVTEIKKKEGEAPARFANAILRKVSEHALSWRELKLKPGASVIDSAQWASLPPWMWTRLEKDHGRAWVEKYALASLARPILWIHARSVSWKVDWAEAGPVPGSFKVLEGGLISEKEGFSEGGFFVQDISSQLLIHEINGAVRDALGLAALSALDLCASPGGKSVGMRWNGMAVTASDRDEVRLALLRQTVERVGEGIQVISSEKVESLDLQDFVWVDAPCTGSGILRRHPDVRWLRAEKEMDGLLKVQQELIARGWEKVKKGGFFAYSVCSVFKDEGVRAIERAGLTVDRQWTLVPQDAPHGDGFWACLIRKK